MRRKNIEVSMSFNFKGFDLKHTEIRQNEITDNFCSESIFSADGVEEVRIVDPIVMILNQERLDKVVGNSAAQSFIDSFRNQKTDPFAELRSKCSDEDLAFMIKSRHLQAPCEILAWATHMKNNMDYFTSEVQKLIEAQTPTESIEPQSTEQINE